MPGPNPTICSSSTSQSAPGSLVSLTILISPPTCLVLLVSSLDVINDLYIALDQLFAEGCFNELGIPASAPLYIFGQSYGGKYAPALAANLIDEAKNKGRITGLKGIAIGSGFTSPFAIFS